MSNAIQFLEGMGRNGAMSPDAYAAAVRATGAGQACRQALLDRDVGKLSSLMGGRAQMRGLVAIPDEV